MKKTTFVLTACGLLGCAVSANAAVDVTVNGVQYAITTVTPALTYNPANGNYYFSYPNTLTSDLFNTLTSQVWFGASGPNSAPNFTIAYVNAVEAADPNASTDGALQAADNTVFINSAYGASSASSTTQLGGYNDGYGGTHQLLNQATPLNQPWILVKRRWLPSPKMPPTASPPPPCWWDSLA